MIPFLALLAGMTVYTTHDLARVKPQDAPGEARAVSIQAARNEWAAFQVVVRAGEGGLKGARAAASPLSGPASLEVALWREHYVQVVTPSPRSKEGPGWYPDALVPLETTGFDLEPFRNQPLWAEVYVPKDAPPGRYTGTITVTAEGEPPTQVPVELTVWPFTLPDVPSMRSNFGVMRGSAARGLDSTSAAYRARERLYADALAAHRISPQVPSWVRPVVGRDGTVDIDHDWLMQEWMSRYPVTGISLSLLGSDPLGRDRERNTVYLRSMWHYLQMNGWDRLAYVYVYDEPNTAEAYEEVRRRSAFIHETQPGLKVLCTEQPTPQNADWGSLVGSIDIWVPLWYLYTGPVAERLAAGDEFWSYTALCQGPRNMEVPFWQIDFPLINYRIPAWISWRQGATGLLYWTASFWDQTPDVWTDPLTYRGAFNGEGSLFYPYGDGFLPSMRLKAIRAGMQDYEYIRLLAAAQGTAAADVMVDSVARSWAAWNPDPEELRAARERMARAIMASSGSPTSPMRAR